MKVTKTEWLNQHIQTVDGFPKPDWESVYSIVDNRYQDADQHGLWSGIARSWMQHFASSLGSSYILHESENFLIVTSESKRYVGLFLAFLERTLKRILSVLPGIAADEGYGKHVVIIFDDIGLYYSYMSSYEHRDGEFGLSSGVFLNSDYGHFVFPHQELSYSESIAAHEMTHALLAHLPIPVWLNEGLATNVENLISGSSPIALDKKLFARHVSFWDKRTIQQFWSGESFSRSDEGQELSYSLAQMSVKSLSQDYDVFVQFANKAHFKDGGEAAASGTYEGSLGNLITQFFGPGDWRPEVELDTKPQYLLRTL